MEISAERFDEIMHQHQRRVYRVIFLLVRDRDAADTLTQECFLRAYLKRASSAASARLKPGCCESRSTWHETTARPGDLVLEKTSRSEDRKDDGAEPMQFPHRGRRRNAGCWHAKARAVWNALLPFRRNSEPYSSPLRGRNVLAEIAGVLDVKVGSVKSQLARATGELREMKEREGK